ncbi:MAG: type II secretion system protein GspD [Pseudomonadales bacterium]|nr:type II secretion system protein GspD [Pseudomonadales bacterium]
MIRKILVMVAAGTLYGCQSQTIEPFSIEPIREGRPVEEVSQVRSVVEESARTGNVTPGPSRDFRPAVVDVVDVGELGELPEGAFKASYNNIPVAAFINEVFGEQLQRSFSIEPEVQRLSELVTLRMVEAVSAVELFNVARETLASFGVGIEARSGVLDFSLSQDASALEVPLIITGGALPDVPSSHRPVFLFVPIEVVSSNELRGWLLSALRGQGLNVQNLPQSNALLLQGKEKIVEQALTVIKALDQPSLRGSHSVLFQPEFSDANTLAEDLVNVLGSQGYLVSSRANNPGMLILPLKSMNKLVMFASSTDQLEHAIEWAKTLDQENTASIENGIFSYAMRNTDAEYVVSILNQLIGGTRDDEPDSANTRFIADKNRNAIVYQGNGSDWVRLLGTIQDMDQPVPSVLVEVILAEVTLSELDDTGIEFLARSGDVTFSTLGGIGLGANGLTATLNRAGETRAVLNAFFENDRAKIRSRPRLMVKSGQQASIDVGNEIPFLTSTSQSVENPDSPVIQTVQYRKTGVILQVEPVVHSSGFVDIRISQQLSEAQQNSSSSIDSPSVFNRSLETTVTLRDGGSVLLGGLIAQSSSDSTSGVKGLGSIPGLGLLFRKDSESIDRTELVMMVIPYIIDNPDEAAELSDRALQYLELTL